MHRILTVQEIQDKSWNALSKSGRQLRLRGQIDVMISVRGIKSFSSVSSLNSLEELVGCCYRER